jgi:tetratricopeptide (TPR) repeat protein
MFCRCKVKPGERDRGFLMNRHCRMYACTALVFLVLTTLTLSCASKMPVLYREDGSPLLITDYEKIAQREFDERRYENAIAAYSMIISNYPENRTALTWAHYEIGFCYYMMEDLDQAEFYFRIVLNEFSEPAASILADMMIDKIDEARELEQRKKERWERWRNRAQEQTE